MDSIVPVALTVTGNEKAWTYMEAHQQSPGSRGMRRYRIIVVLRDGTLSEYREDMGDAKKFKGARQLHIPSLFEHTVDELRNWADDLRWEPWPYLDELLENDNYNLV